VVASVAAYGIWQLTSSSPRRPSQSIRTNNRPPRTNRQPPRTTPRTTPGANPPPTGVSPPPTGVTPQPSGVGQPPLAQGLTIDPTPQLAPGQQQTLRQVAARTWAFLSGPDLDPVTHLPLNNVPLAGSSAPVFTSPTEIGLYLSSIVAARDLGLATPAQALTDASQVLSTIERLQKYQGFPLRWYSTASAEAITGPRGGPVVGGGVVSTVDDSWFAQGVAVAEQAFPQLTSAFGQILGAMNYSLLYDAGKGVLYDSYSSSTGPSAATYNLAYGGPRIADYMAMGSRTVPGALWWALNRTPPTRSSQRQVPQGRTATYADPQSGRAYSVFEGHYAFGGLQFVPTFGGSMFEALAPDLVIPEQTYGPRSMGLNDRNTVLAQIHWARTALGYPVWGLAPATTPARPTGYAQYGAPGLATNPKLIPDNAVAPYASFLALGVLPAEAYQNIATLISLYPSIYGQYGFLDSVDPSTHRVAQRYMEVSQAVILMALDNALDHDKLQTYLAGSSVGAVIGPYLSTEQFSITAAAGSTGGSPAGP
jgi:hypothetical protein